ncbi:TPA: phage tail protein [Escherichia coli]|nr:phage tail protein [Escherichia coli]HAL6905747.1 phage tail protein [Escherichia coli]
MGLGFFRSIYDHIAFAASVSAVTIGAMTISEKIALAGLLLGALSLFQGWLHRRRMERAQVRRNALIAQILAQAGTRGLHESEQRALAALQQDNDEKH